MTLRIWKETHRYLFQDLPKAGLWDYDVPPGAFRKETSTWRKDRILTSIESQDGKLDTSFTSYSRIGVKSIERLEATLKAANPERLKGPERGVFVESISTLFCDLDYLHPVLEGNSRTLRTFTVQLAREAGYKRRWEILSEEGKCDSLFIACDRGLAECANKDEDHHPSFLAEALYDMERHQNYPSLALLLDKTVERMRAAP